jgi:hypothetical protein
MIIRKQLKFIAILLVTIMLAEFSSPAVCYALTGGPSQPEVQSFEPIGTSEMVDVSSGDFNYNIPLLDVGGYPVNISYHSGIGMDQEASWVGLGWNINPGVINRNMRGLPDDFDGEKVTKEYNIKPDETFGESAGLNIQLFGTDLSTFGMGLGFTLGMYYNNYKGVGFEASVNPSISAGDKTKGELNAGLGLSANSQSGATLTPSLGLSHTTNSIYENDDISNSLSVGASFNSRTGLKALTFSASTDHGTYTPGVGFESDNPEGAVNGGSAISFANPTYVPNISMPMNNYSLTLSATLGSAIIGIHGSEKITGYYTNQSLARSTMTAPAFGYFYSEDSYSDPYAMLDFNREKDGAFNEHTPALPLTNFSCDIYSVSGQGIGGMYKPTRGDVGVVYDNYAENNSLGGSLGLEFGVGNAAHGGMDLNINTSNSKTGVWQDKNDALMDIGFRGQDKANPFYEPFYFKNVGEKTADPDNFFDEIGGFNPVRVALEDRGLDVATKRGLSTSTSDEVGFPTYNIKRNLRNRRNQEISYLTAVEAGQIGLQKQIQVYQPNIFLTSPSPLYRTGNSGRNSRHISEITATREDGARYVYGIPAYNTTQKEVSFNVSAESHDNNVNSTGIITYSPNQNSTSNNEGLDHYYTSTTLPGYAHSYLLTAILSADYVDVTGDGPTDDDLGSYTLFNYSKEESLYNWRTPVEDHTASFNEGMKSDNLDDKGNYIYGQKEVWYLHSIETKNYIAEFTLSDNSVDPRQDGLGVLGEDGGKNINNRVRALNKITLYSRPDRLQNGSNAVPIKVVHFEYNYSLCPGVKNNSNSAVMVNGVDINANHGKLTLTKIYFTYGNSSKAKLSSYQFSYGCTNNTGGISCNPGYDLKGYDRWGNFKPNNASSGLSNADNPYVSQDLTPVPNTVNNYYNKLNPDATYPDAYASSWELTKIKLPSGGVINVNYESDDYAYVQDKPAMQMFNLLGMGNSPSGLAGDFNRLKDYNYIFFQTSIPSGTNSAVARTTLARDYIKDIGTNNLYFRCLVQIGQEPPDPSNPPDPKTYEYVPGYASIDFDETNGNSPYGVVASGQYYMGFIHLKTVNLEDNPPNTIQVNPISKAAWQFARLNAPRIAYNESDIKETGVEQVLTALGSMANSMTQLFNGFNSTLNDQNYGYRLDRDKSFLRLYCPTYKKKGGGSRVKNIIINDKWGSLADPGTGTYDQPTNVSSNDVGYGQAFYYTKTIQLSTNVTQEISTGVASYEPIIGGDENPFRQPIFFDENELLAPGNHRYVEQPLGESFFPSPTVIYSQVKTQNFVCGYSSQSPNDPPVMTNTNNGYTINEFYTAKDFPTVTSNTGLKPTRKKSNPILSFLKIDNKDYLTASEGFCIELNDMHGKPKAQWVYAQGNPTPISGTEYIYRTDYIASQEQNPLPTTPGRLDRLNNTVKVINNMGQMSNAQIGVDVDFVADSRESATETYGVGMQGNLDAFLAFIFPGIVPMIFPSYNCEKTRFRSMGTTKVINRYGILQKTIAHQDNAKVTTENIAYDPESGEVLLTQTYNEYEDPIYNITYPAHWIYDRMGPACQNIGIQFKAISITGNSSIGIYGAKNYFVPGDELAYAEGANITRLWVLYVHDNDIVVIGKDGSSGLASLPGNSTGFGDIKIVRSGRRNQQTTPVFTASLLNNPFPNNSLQLFDRSQSNYDYQVLNVSANEFDEHWQTPTGKQGTAQCDCQPSSELNQLVTFMNNLGSNLRSSALLWSKSGGLVNLDYTEILRRNIQEQNLHYWSGSVTSNVFTGYIYDPTFAGNGIMVQLTFPGTVPGTFTISNVTPLYHNSENCTNCNEFTRFFTATVNGSQVTGYISGFPAGTCHQTFTSGCGVQVGSLVNPYEDGVLGDWRKWKSSAFLIDRKQTSTQTNTRKDGTFSTFEPFWYVDNNSGQWAKSSNNHWVSASQVTKYSPYGNELEDRDALGNYSSEIFGYNHSLVTAVASNARYNQIGFDNFEDYSSAPEGGCTFFSHWNFNSAGASIDNSYANSHSGRTSMKLYPGNQASVTRVISQPADKPGIDVKNSYSYNLTSDEVLGRFSPWLNSDPQNNERYVISAWVKEKPLNMVTLPVSTYASTIDITIQPAPGQPGTPVSFPASPSGNIIDGWQRIYIDDIFIPSALLTDPNHPPQIVITLHATGSGSVDFVNFDDIRIHPFTANMKSYVYDPTNYRLVAILDENNYATFYEYNEEGALTRTKKETQNGVFTIQEVRTSKAK